MGYDSRKGNSPPAWFIFLLGVAFTFGIFYLWTNFRDFVRTGGVSVSQATHQSVALTTATAERQVSINADLPTRRPSPTAKPPCQDFEVSATSGNMRQAPTTASNLIESLPEGTVVCVLQGDEGDGEFIWYLIDRDPVTRLIEPGYMREDVIRPINPTPTPSDTSLPPPTITLTYTVTAVDTPLEQSTRNPNSPILEPPP
ncbi:MAG: hypothetical protein Q9P01_20485 [Anaerolineae bacterium]|nr:hypothetical protein [Anaerolineae bacterium]MDQ7037126.1 hypothetical protein [Anaerolineae bacterium]